MKTIRTKFVYVVVANEGNYYFEQMLISALSLKQFNPNANIYVLVDVDTYSFIEQRKQEYETVISGIIKVETPCGFNNMRKSRFIKTNLRNLIEGDFLFIDTDTAICGDISDVDSLECELGAVPDQHVPIRLFNPVRNLYDWAKVAGFSVENDNNFYFNSGVIYCKDTQRAKAFFTDWYQFWRQTDEKGLSYDQPSFAKANESQGNLITCLDGIWNCQIVENGLKFLCNAKIVHYFSSGVAGNKQSAYLLYNQDIYELVRMEGINNPRIRELLKDPRVDFGNDCKVITGQDTEYLHSIMNVMFKQHPLMFKSIEIASNQYLRILRILSYLKKGIIIDKLKSKL